MTTTLAVGLDYVGVGFLSASGALAAAERKQDLITFIFFGALTGIGGGSLRDLLIEVPVFWVHDAGYVVVCALASICVWLLRGRGLDLRWLLWFDALGLSTYAVVGAAKADAVTLNAPVCIVMGTLTACFGGVLRDVLAGQPSVLLRREIYVTAAILAATVYIALARAGAPLGVAAGIAVSCGLGLRAGAITLGWHLPHYQPRDQA